MQGDIGLCSQSVADRAIARLREKLEPMALFFCDDDICHALTHPDDWARPSGDGLSNRRRHTDVETVAAAMRSLLDPAIAAACTDIDLDWAVKDVTAPLVASLCSGIQVWHFRQQQAARALLIEDQTHNARADLWSIPPRWARDLGLIRCEEVSRHRPELQPDMATILAGAHGREM